MNSSEVLIEAIEICKLIVSAAAKQTIGAQRLRAAGAGPTTPDRIGNNANAVGRLHNAAKRARAILPADVVAEIEAAANKGANILD